MKEERHNQKQWLYWIGCIMAVAILLPVPGYAQDKWGYKKKGDPAVVWVDGIVYRETKDAYYVTKAGTGYEVPRGAIESLTIPKPVTFDKYAAELKLTGLQQEQAISGMESVADKYKMLEWDIKALAELVPVYAVKNQYDKVVSACKYIAKITDAVPEQLLGRYWTALLAKGETATLKQVLSKTIESGTRGSAAVAHMVRGDIYMKDGKPAEALVDGYLRVVLLFQDIKSVQPEALYKTWQALNSMKDPRATKFRGKLLDEYPQSEYAKKMS